MQLPFFRALGLDLTSFHPATLNVSVAPRRFVLSRPSHVFRQVRWSPQVPPEDFSFVPCRVAYGREVHEGVVYYPHPETKPAHHHDPSVLEVITRFIPGIAYGAPIEVALPRECVRIIDSSES